MEDSDQRDKRSSPVLSCLLFHRLIIKMQRSKLSPYQHNTAVSDNEATPAIQMQEVSTRRRPVSVLFIQVFFISVKSKR